MRYFILLVSLAFFAEYSFAQSDSSSIKEPQRVYTHYDTLQLAKLNSSGNLMIAAGVGLCGAGSFLIYAGVKIYTASALPGSTNPADDINRNHKQGTIYLVASGVSIAGGIVLVALGARNKVDFKMQKKMMELQSGILDNGRVGFALNF